MYRWRYGGTGHAGGDVSTDCAGGYVARRPCIVRGLWVVQAVVVVGSRARPRMARTTRIGVTTGVMPPLHLIATPLIGSIIISHPPGIITRPRPAQWPIVPAMRYGEMRRERGDIRIVLSLHSFPLLSIFLI